MKEGNQLNRWKNKLITRIKKENEYGKLYIVSLKKLYKSRISIRHFFTPSRALIAFVFIVGSLQMLKDSHGSNGITLLMFSILIILLLYMKHRFLPRYRPFEPTLRNFIYQNDLYEEKNGCLLSELRLAYIEDSDVLRVIIEKNGDRYQKVANQLGESLESKLSKQLHETNETIDYVEYIFLKNELARKQVATLPKEDDSLHIQIHGDFSVNLRNNNYSMLVSGASGAGKSYFTYFWLTRFISQVVNGRHAVLMGIDPKQSDLFTLFKQSKMPAENYGTSVADAFRIVRAYTAEMNKRIEAYSESGAFNSVAIDLGYSPALLIIEEYSSLVATMDSKQKKEFENMVAVIAQKSRQLSMGLLIVMQQPRADSLSTNVKEQLQNTVFLGTPSRESAQMMFATSDVPTVNGTGVGLYSIEREAPKVFESPQFNGNVFDVILPIWKHVAESYMLEKGNKKEFT